ncbi:hypothetical protein [Bifidobacterium vespertilionis]|uniref:hypothetical protein n=1 Tax=Bifidobacterium vespertilionis TaxID=2562524 RepID=UPI001BDC2E53|nr:hypothetical protein [Bifidobacterium vespertilionis]MBT1179914.1 hypothetical protein [Bifidobacterium vespertilionis]
MTSMESLPAYAEAEAAARRNGLHVTDLINAYLAGFAAGSAATQLGGIPVDAAGYPVFELDVDKFDVVRPKVDEATGEHVWPKDFLDD